MKNWGCGKRRLRKNSQMTLKYEKWKGIISWADLGFGKVLWAHWVTGQTWFWFILALDNILRSSLGCELSHQRTGYGDFDLFRDYRIFKGQFSLDIIHT